MELMIKEQAKNDTDIGLPSALGWNCSIDWDMKTLMSNFRKTFIEPN
jgi:hypothetical protein